MAIGEKPAPDRYRPPAEAGSPVSARRGQQRDVDRRSRARTAEARRRDRQLFRTLDAGRGGEAVLRDTLNLASQLRDWARQKEIEVVGIGAGVAELVDCHGNVTSSCTINWRGVPVQEKLSEIMPAQVESDVRTAALAEAIFGTGRGHRLFAYITVGTGISYCLVQDGRPLKGANGNAITLSSSPLSTVCTHCGAKLRPVLEEFASGPAIAKRFAQVRKSEKISAAEEVFRAASNGDRAPLSKRFPGHR